MLKTSMADSLGGNAGDPRVPTTYLEEIDGAPLEGITGDWERPPPILKTSMVGPLGGSARDPRAPTTYLEDCDIPPLSNDG
jgi:hypothetical protein